MFMLKPRSAELDPETFGVHGIATMKVFRSGKYVCPKWQTGVHRTLYSRRGLVIHSAAFRISALWTAEFSLTHDIRERPILSGRSTDRHAVAENKLCIKAQQASHCILAARKMLKITNEAGWLHWGHYSIAPDRCGGLSRRRPVVKRRWLRWRKTTLA